MEKCVALFNETSFLDIDWQSELATASKVDSDVLSCTLKGQIQMNEASGPGRTHAMSDLSKWLARHGRQGEVQWDIKMSGYGDNISWVATCTLREGTFARTAPIHTAAINMAAISALLALNTPAAIQGGQPHPQTDLQNWLTRNDRWDELQWEFKMSGSGSNHSWVVTCDLQEGTFTGTGSTRSVAKDIAATNALLVLDTLAANRSRYC